MPVWNAAAPNTGAALFLVLFCASCAGWGRGLRGLLLPQADTGTAVDAAVGVGLIAFAGGVLNLAGLAMPPATTVLLLAGVLLLALDLIRQRPGVTPWHLLTRHSPRELLERILALALGSFALGCLSFGPVPNQHDDCAAYMVFPLKLAETGRLGPDFFSERRLESALGSLYFLQSLALQWTDAFHLHVIDPVFGYLLLLAALWRASAPAPSVAAGDCQVARWQAWLPRVLALSPALFLPFVVNLGATTLPVALLVCAVLLLRSHAVQSMRAAVARAILVAVIAAAACGTKSTVIPYAVVLLGLLYAALVATSGWRRGVAEAAICALMSAVFLAPWMIAQWQDTGTPLFPILGIGGYGAQYGDIANFDTFRSTAALASIYWHDAVLSAPVLFTALVTGIALCLRRWRHETLFLVLLPTQLLATLALCFAMGGERLAYYAFVADATTMALAGIWAATLVRNDCTRPVPAAASLILAVGVIGALGLHTWRHRAALVEHDAVSLLLSLGAHAVRPVGRATVWSAMDDPRLHEPQKILALQSSVPPRTPILERLDFAFALDFHRNPIWLADWPGGASPPPGMPLFQGPEKLAAYLLVHGIRYVAYAYADEALFAYADRGRLWQQPWVLTDARATFDFQANLRALMRTRALPYCDNERAMIDLATRQANADRACATSGATP